MTRKEEQRVPLVVGLFLIFLTMMSVYNVGLSVANGRDITRTNAKLNALINQDSHSESARVTKRKLYDESAVPAKDGDDPSLELTPHPIYANVMMSKMIYPNTTSSVGSSQHLEQRDNPKPRYLWWTLGVAKLGETGYAMYSLISDCQSWAGSDQTADSTKVGCVYGAISTLLTLGGAGYSTYAYGAQIAGVLKTWYSYRRKRGEPGDSGALDSTLLEYQNFMVNISQAPMALMFDESANLITFNDTGLPVMFGINSKGDGMLVTYQPNPDNVSEATAIYGFVPPPSGDLHKRSTFYDEENFLRGGLEVAYAYNQNSDGGWLSEHNDYGQMDHEVSCLFDDLSGNAYAWQIYDNNLHGTIAGGAIRAFQYETYGGQYLNSAIRGGIARLPRCEVA
jgi:hypothetical protein